MPFTTSLIDNFNRSNEVPVSGGIWNATTPYTVTTTEGALRVTSNQLDTEKAAAGSGNSAAQVLTAVQSGSSGSCEAYLTMTDSSASSGVTTFPASARYGIILRAEDPSSGTPHFYLFSFIIGGGGSFSSATITRNARNTVNSTIATTSSLPSGYTPATGDKLLGLLYDMQDPGVLGVALQLWIQQGTKQFCLCYGVDPVASALTANGRMGAYLFKNTSGSSAVRADDFSGGGITVSNRQSNIPYGGVVIEEDVDNTDADAGTFKATTLGGQSPTVVHPILGDYPLFPTGDDTGYGGGLSMF